MRTLEDAYRVVMDGFSVAAVWEEIGASTEDMAIENLMDWLQADDTVIDTDEATYVVNRIMTTMKMRKGKE